MRVLMIVLAIYLIVFAGFIVASSVLAIGETIPPLRAVEALLGILLTVPLFILGVLVIKGQ